MGFDISKLIEREKKQKLQQKALSRGIIEDLITKAVRVYKKYNIKKAFIFGSVLNEECYDKSDIDLLVCGLSPKEFWSCQCELEDIMERRVDLYDETDEAEFVQKVMQRGRLIYEC